MSEQQNQQRRGRGRPANQSNAPSIKPETVIHISPDGRTVTYNAWKKSVLNNGEIVYHRQTRVRTRRDKVDGVFKRPNRQKNEARLRQIEKKKLLNRVKQSLLSDEFNVDMIKAICTAFNVPMV